MVKILSVDPKNYDDAPTEAIRRVLEIYYGTSIPRGTGLDTKDIGGRHPELRAFLQANLLFRVNTHGDNRCDKRTAREER